jgi:tetratricopeptide (TPR) repeat protein
LVALRILTDVQLERNDLAGAQASGEECLVAARAAGDPTAVSATLYYLGYIALSAMDLPRATALLEESLGSIRSYKPVVLNVQGALACYQGDYERATALCSEALEAFRASGFKHGVAHALHNLGDVALCQGHVSRAATLFVESLRLCRVEGNQQRGVWSLSGLASVAALDGCPLRAVMLWSAAEAIRASIGAARPALRMEDYRQWVVAARGHLDERAAASTEAAGRAMRFVQAVEYALQEGEGA